MTQQSLPDSRELLVGQHAGRVQRGYLLQVRLGRPMVGLASRRAVNSCQGTIDRRNRFGDSDEWFVPDAFVSYHF